MNLFVFSLRLNGINVSKAINQLELLQGKQIERRDAIVDYHKKNNPLYRELLQGMNITSFEELPILTKKHLQRPLRQIISDGLQLKRLYVANTSGSSGHPFFYAKDKDSHALTHAIILRLYAQYGLTFNDKQARFYGIPLRGLSKRKEQIKDFLCNRVRFPVFDLSDERLSDYLSVFRSQKFGYVYGYTSAIVLFAKYLLRQGVLLQRVCPTLRCCIVTSEVCTSEDKNTIEKAFGVMVVNEYGCSEAGLIAFEDIQGDWAMVCDDSYYEVVDEVGNLLPYGNEGRILITSLSNKAIPIIRYEVGDIGVIDKVDDKLILRKLLGRVSDTIKLPSGRVAAGLTFYYIARSILENEGFVREFIVRQTFPDTFVFEMVMDRDLTEGEKIFLQQQLDVFLEPNLKLIVNRVDSIQRPASGKIKHFYSELK